MGEGECSARCVNRHSFLSTVRAFTSPRLRGEVGPRSGPGEGTFSVRYLDRDRSLNSRRPAGTLELQEQTWRTSQSLFISYSH